MFCFRIDFLDIEAAKVLVLASWFSGGGALVLSSSGWMGAGDAAEDEG